MLALSANRLTSLPETISRLESLAELRIDDNPLPRLPSCAPPRAACRRPTRQHARALPPATSTPRAEAVSLSRRVCPRRRTELPATFPRSRYSA